MKKENDSHLIMINPLQDGTESTKRKCKKFPEENKYFQNWINFQVKILGNELDLTIDKMNYEKKIGDYWEGRKKENNKNELKKRAKH